MNEWSELKLSENRNSVSKTYALKQRKQGTLNETENKLKWMNEWMEWTGMTWN